jgi:hypothetical protein
MHYKQQTLTSHPSPVAHFPVLSFFMDGSNIVQVSHESNIMMSSETPNKKNRWKLYVLIACLTLFLGILTTGIIGLSASVSIPEEPIVLIYTSPKKLNQLFTPSQQKLLPPAWQSALQTNSFWPATFGLTREQDRWNGFVIAPSWSINTKNTLDGINIQKIKFVTLAIDTPTEEATVSLSYSQSIRQALKYPFSLISATFNPPTDQIQPFTIYEKNRELHTDIPYKNTNQESQIKQADLSINLYRDSIFSLLTSQVKIGSQTMQNLTTKPVQMSLSLDEKLNPIKTSFIFNQNLNQEETGKLMSAFGIRTTRIITLPDGSQALDRSALQDIQGELATTTKYGEISWNGTELIIGSTTSAFKNTEAACSIKTTARLSNKIIAKIIGIDQVEPLPNLQIGEKDGKMVICFEK